MITECRVSVPLVLLVAMVSGATRSASAQANSPALNVRAAVSRAWADHIAAAEKKDVAAVVAMYADDVVYIIDGGEEVRGRAAIEKMEATALASCDVLAAIHTIEALTLAGDAAYELGTVAGSIKKPDQPPEHMTFHFMAMWQRQRDGTWRIRYMVGRS